MFPAPFSSPFAHFDRFFDNGPRSVLSQLLHELDQPGFHRQTTVPVTAWSDAGSATITAEVPGVTASDLQIDATNDTLTISGTRRRPDGDQTDGTVLVQERPTATFRRTISLPWRIDPEQIEARLEHGILTVVLHRAEADKPRRIAIAA